MTRRTLPRLVVALIERRVTDPISRAGLVGDMEERYTALAGATGARRALWLATELTAIWMHYTREEEAGTMDRLRQDLGFALRAMGRRPGFSLLVVLTLALGIGANGAIFSVVNGLLLEPLPFEDGDRLAIINEREPSGFTASVSFPNFRDWKERTRAFDRMATILPSSRRFATDEGTRIVEVGFVMGGFFETLATQPAVGRYFTEPESGPGAERLAVLSHGFWVESFGADPSIVGRSIELSDEPFVVVGVTPPDFVLLAETSVFMPLGIVIDRLPWDDRRSSVGASVVARLAPGATFEGAQAELIAVARTLTEEIGELADPGNVTPLRSWFIGDTGRQSLILLAAVGLTLLVACANVANLLFVSSERRSGEMALRAALGASRGRVYRQLLTESLVIAVAGGIGGVALAVLGLNALLGVVADVLPTGFADRIRIDAGVLGFTALLTLGTAVLAGFLPALRSARTELADRLRRAAPGAIGNARARDALIAGEVALSMILLVGAGLLIATLTELQNVDKGFDGSDVLTFRLQTPGERYDTRETWSGFHTRLREELEAQPGVLSAGASQIFPLSGNSWEMLYRDEQTPPDDEGESVLLTMVSPSFFETFGIPILAGRNFTESDRWGAENVAIVDETLAAARWPDESPIGKRITFEQTSNEAGEMVPVWRTVVGVAGHVRHYELTTPSRIEVYTPHAQSVSWGFTSFISVRASGDPAELIPRVRSVVAELEPAAPMYRVRTMPSIIAEELGLHRAMRELLTVMAGLTLLLGCVGIYSVVSHTTTLRLKELSLRIALGGAPSKIARLVVRDSVPPIVLGVVAGAAGAAALGRLLRSVLYEVGPTDPRVLGVSALLLLTVATLSAWLPARRAARISPQEVLRTE